MRDFKVKFRSDKSQVLAIDGGEDDDERTWKLDAGDISRTNEYKYMGCVLNTSDCEKAKNEKLFRAQQWYRRLGSAARFRANWYECFRGIWKNIAVPSIMYGKNVMKWTKGELDKLEVIQNKVGRMALGANRYVGVEAIRGDREPV